MIRLVYISQSVKPVSSDDLMSLLRQCRTNNTKNNLTGVLLYHNECFIQVLEGKEEVINKVYEKIKKDPRHKNVIELNREYISERQFDQWSMGFEEVNEAQLAALNIDGLNDFFSKQKQNPDLDVNQTLIAPLMKFFKTSYEKRQAHEELPIHDDQQGILILFHKAIRFAVTILAFLMVLVIFLGVADVVYVIYQKLLLTPPHFLMTIPDILATFGAFLAVLIAIEIFLNISLYLRSDVIPVKLVVATALMAISRKVIIFDFKSLQPEYVYSSAAVVLALGLTYWLIDKKPDEQ
ncbi:phosphate-starvation-inducible PsiE family protein [Methylomarinum vadi]|uniref:phosphate-starvation-inducible PsiE family protein n=1 Tax=Methylomarinum vadi TaxID=438855 RepID=UPI0004DF0416|nr:phosphate-starvation-inducible PsiE family protein [Methylomarinum vadi]